MRCAACVHKSKCLGPKFFFPAEHQNWMNGIVLSGLTTVSINESMVDCWLKIDEQQFESWHSFLFRAVYLVFLWCESNMDLIEPRVYLFCIDDRIKSSSQDDKWPTLNAQYNSIIDAQVDSVNTHSSSLQWTFCTKWQTWKWLSIHVEYCQRNTWNIYSIQHRMSGSFPLGHELLLFFFSTYCSFVFIYGRDIKSIQTHVW